MPLNTLTQFQLARKTLQKWCVIQPESFNAMTDLVPQIQAIGRTMGLRIATPTVITYTDLVPELQLRLFAPHIRQHESDMVFFIAGKETTAYKRHCMAEFKWQCAGEGVLTQFAQEMDVTPTHDEYGRVLWQMTLMMGVKIGNVPWTVPLPNDNIMTIGYATENRDEGMVFGGIVASMNNDGDHKFHVRHTLPASRREADQNRCFLQEVQLALMMYERKNHTYPERIIIYRRYNAANVPHYVPHDVEAQYLREKLSTKIDIVFIVVKTTENTCFFNGDLNPDSGLVILTSRLVL